MFWLCCSGGEELAGDLVPGMSSFSTSSMWRRGSSEQLRAGASLDGAAGASRPKWLLQEDGNSLWKTSAAVSVSNCAGEGGERCARQLFLLINISFNAR